jgi:hypothetical protein
MELGRPVSFAALWEPVSANIGRWHQLSITTHRPTKWLSRSEVTQFAVAPLAAEN